MTADRPVVASVALHRVGVPLRRPHRAAHGSEAAREVVLVEVRLADGSTGWGECSALSAPTYTYEWTATVWTVLTEIVAPALVAGHPPALVGHPMAVAGVATALADAVLQGVGRSLAQELAGRVGGSPAVAMPSTAVVSMADTVDDVLAEVAERVGDGAAMVKLKVSRASDDLAVVEAVRSTWPSLALAVDFNGSADRAALRRLDPLGLAYVEQPAPADALVESVAMAACIEAPIALDESVSSRDGLDAAVALGACRAVNVKPSRVGGPAAAADLVAHARNAGVDVFVGGMLETGVGRAAALAVAALPGCSLPTDLGPSARYFEHDLTDAIEQDGLGRVLTPTGAGIGVRPDPARLEAATIERWSSAG